MKPNVAQQKSYDFALRIIKVYAFLVQNKKEFVLSKQILHSGTSIGANVEEAIGGQSRADFLSKMAVAYKEARETHHWLRLLHDGRFLTSKQFDSLSIDCDELMKILGSIQKTVKKIIRNS